MRRRFTTGIVIGLVLAASILTVMSVSTMVRADEGEAEPTAGGIGFPLVFQPGGSPAWSLATRIYTDGFNVGIGTRSPAALLHVFGGTRLTIQGFSNAIQSQTYIFPHSPLGDKPHYFFIGAPSTDGDGDLYFGRTEKNDASTNADYDTKINGSTGNWTFYKSVGIRTTTPASALQVRGYTQLDLTPGMPPAGDCDEATERGRMKVDSAAGMIYVCVNSGWVGNN